MASRLKLHEELCDLLQSRNVYFSPPPSVLMKYDAIRYSLSDPSIDRANDKVYLKVNKYEGLVITQDPDSVLPDAILNHFEVCSLGKPYTADNLYHFPFTIYY